MTPILVALITVAGTIFAVIWSTRKAVKAGTQSNSNDHELVIEAIGGLRDDVSQVREMLFEHITDRGAHFYVERSLGSPVRRGPDPMIRSANEGPIASERPTTPESAKADVKAATD